MVKVTVEHNGTKQELSGEFFMGFALTHKDTEKDTEGYFLQGSIVGTTDMRYLPKNMAVHITNFVQNIENPLDRVIMMHRLIESLNKDLNKMIEGDTDKLADTIINLLKGEKR